MSDTPPTIDAPGLFVAGTGTGVGKTVVTAGVTGWLRQSAVDAVAVKPAQTGAPEDDDARFVTRACCDDEAATCLRRLRPPLAPRVAAEQEGVSLSFATLVEQCQAAIDDADVGVVEGIGGLRVPLTGNQEVIDLVDALNIPAVVVARSGLGTLNHTALSVAALRDRGVSVRGVVLNEYSGETIAEQTNPDELRRMLDCPVATMPPGDLDDPRAAISLVSSAVPNKILEST